MSIFLRIWTAFAVVLLLGAYVTVSNLQDQVKPSVRQAIEDTLADNANLMSALVVDDMRAGRLQTPEFQHEINAMLQRQLRGQIWEHDKAGINQHLYITNDKGMVLYDSQGKAVGQDFSRWNDVYLTLKGRYGVRTTRSNPADPNSSVMFVAAPIIDQGRIIGVVTLSKAGKVVQPFIERAQKQMLKQGIIVAVLALLFSALVAWWLRHAIYRVSQYALTLSPQQRQPLRFWAARELNQLVDAIDKMRQELEGKHYVENYVHTLTHELKSPLTAIKASAELLQDDLPAADRLRFSDTICQQTDKLQRLIEHLLLLARLEKLAQADRQPLHLAQLINKVLSAKAAQIQQRQLHIHVEIPEALTLAADAFWLEQAVSNLIDNALDFTPPQHTIAISALSKDGKVCLSVHNQGEAIPDYALTQVFDRYYSLPRPENQRKSTGLGLTLVQEVMTLHGGKASIANTQEGVLVLLVFP